MVYDAIKTETSQEATVLKFLRGVGAEKPDFHGKIKFSFRGGRLVTARREQTHLLEEPTLAKRHQ